MDVVKLQAAIELANASWQAGVTSVSELSDEEKKLRLGYQPAPGEPSLQEREQIARLNSEAFKTAKTYGQVFGFPTSYDLRAGGFVTPMKDQGNCGSCVAFGTIATIEATFRRQRNNPNLNVNLSEAHLFYCYAKSEGFNCNTGWYADKAMEAAKKGIVDKDCFPYTPGNQDCKLCSDWQNRLVLIGGYHKISDVSAMKEWLSSRGALSACFSVYDDFFAYKSGVYRHVTGNLAGGHCISIVGYDDSQGFWICKNSWGTGWGEQGFFKIAYGECGIEAWVYAVDGIVETGWLNNVKVQGLWTNNSDLNSYVYLSDGIGWRRLCTASVNAHLDMLAQLTASKQQERLVSVYQLQGMITEVYAW
ncbi:peptidase C1 [Scytonema sp. UIC 10036]|uniref:C1 family peptidase n=1 Tax=Scytonema sp. UIC 10036 TaxID=2304196 RepID=UPI0012DA36A6|nr:C1 family peptidase [Scytonema sp. UIC 10036]MUG93591.1 peptidase C1 [Scytonema sp. UIC 10036]